MIYPRVFLLHQGCTRAGAYQEESWYIMAPAPGPCRSSSLFLEAKLSLTSSEML